MPLTYLRLVVCVVWAAAIGISVPLEMANTTFLNRASQNSQYHAFYVSNLAVIMGGLELLPLSNLGASPWRRPSQWWHLLGGLCSIPAFVTIPASALLGTQIVLITQLAALMSTFLILDTCDGRVKLSDGRKALGLAIVMSGVAWESLGGSAIPRDDVNALVLLILVAASGVGYGLQARCNGCLAEDVGSGVRATIVSALVNIFCSLPIDAWIFWGSGVRPTFDLTFWYLWLVAGFQSAFYIASMAYLPKFMGFTSCYVITLASKLVTSLVVDQLGLTGSVIQATLSRVASVLCVLFGSMLFNSRKTSGSDEDIVSSLQEERQSNLISGSFVSVASKVSAIDGSLLVSSTASQQTRSSIVV